MVKRFLIFSLFSSIIALGNIYGVKTDVNYNLPNMGLLSHNMEDQIELHGSLAEFDLRSGYSPINVLKGADYIRVGVLDEDLGVISVQITDEAGNTVYYDSMDTSMQNELLIDTSGWTNGVYGINFYNANGKRLYGEFEI